jgi:hypothetical protein
VESDENQPTFRKQNKPEKKAAWSTYQDSDFQPTTQHYIPEVKTLKIFLNFVDQI